MATIMEMELSHKKKDQAEQTVYIDSAVLPDILAWASGDVLRYPYQDEEVSEKDRKMRSLAVMHISDQGLYAPMAGTITAIDAAHNQLTIHNDSGLALTIKVCKSCVSLETGANMLVHAGQQVEAGDQLVDFGAVVHTKSKLLLAQPMPMDEFKALGYTPAHPCSLIEKGALLLTRKA